MLMNICSHLLTYIILYSALTVQNDLLCPELLTDTSDFIQILLLHGKCLIKHSISACAFKRSIL